MATQTNEGLEWGVRGWTYVTVGVSTAAALFAAVWIYILLAPLAFMELSYPEWISKRTLIERCDLGDVSVFGDSRIGTAIIPALFPMKVSNLALSGSGAIESYYVLKEAMRCPNFPRRVILSWSLPHLLKADPSFWGRGARLGILNYSDFREIDRNSQLIGDRRLYDLRQQDGLPPRLRDLLYTIFFPPFYFNDLTEALIFTRYPINRVRLAYILESRGHVTYGEKIADHTVSDEGKNETFTASKLMDYYFEQMLGMLAARGVHVDFVTTPINETTGNRIGQDIRRSFTAYLDEKAQRFPQLHIVGPMIAAWPDDYFGDGSSHLNARGAVRFSNALSTLLASRPH